MYSYEDRLRAVRLYIKYDFCPSDTVRELGYPNRKMLVRWYKEYLETGDLHNKYIKKPYYSVEQKMAAVNYYLEHGRNLSRTIRVVGYPARETLRQWLDEFAPNERKLHKNHSANMIQFSHEHKKAAVIEFCARKGSAAAVAEAYGNSRYSLYKWKKELLGANHG